MDALYTAEALSTGNGRMGHVRTDDGAVDLDMNPPKSLGGSGVGSNPEQLFASGYAACFHSAVLGAARSEKVTLNDSSVGARVSIGALGDGAYGLAVALEVVLPGTDPTVARRLADIAHANCPYSNATRGNIEVTVTVSDD
ncbi:organic hydroperoxide resistance protein [Jatrophihabitans endophyticus]|uniref:organic hydroperoxide resistance protein n=1 Tax=Jatrophihabitans endophyticus TaxID=1206085 RepID=UPI001A0966DD|nr:organic hydroperoxide resistance protein [Jatrophihabitans endophyticus]MBE7190414.1 organic hydroperoxide resistance protein [Jatrophihabitans endophyticus]